MTTVDDKSLEISCLVNIFSKQLCVLLELENMKLFHRTYYKYFESLRMAKLI